MIVGPCYLCNQNIYLGMFHASDVKCRGIEVAQVLADYRISKVHLKNTYFHQQCWEHISGSTKHTYYKNHEIPMCEHCSSPCYEEYFSIRLVDNCNIDDKMDGATYCQSCFNSFYSPDWIIKAK